MSGPVNVHVEEINATLIRLRLEPTDVLIVKIPDAPAQQCQVAQLFFEKVLKGAGLRNRVVAVPGDWTLEAVSQAELVTG